jgi:hypothetical protein
MFVGHLTYADIYATLASERGREEVAMDIGKERRTIYIEPIEEPASPVVEEPSPEVDPRPSTTEREPEPAR